MPEQPRCACGKPATKLCDYWFGFEESCDAPLCERCTHQMNRIFLCGDSGCLTDSIDYCPKHYTMDRLGKRDAQGLARLQRSKLSLVARKER